MASDPGLSLMKALSQSEPLLLPIAVIGGLVGFYSTRWCWLWALENPHPMLARLETWLPLRGKWLTYGMASLIFPLHWGVIMLMLFLTCALPCSGLLTLPIVWMAIQLPLEPRKSTKQ